MSLFRYKNIIIFLILIGIVSFFSMFLITDYSFIHKIQKPLQSEVMKKNNKEVVAQRYYTQCGHFVEEESLKELNKKNLSIEELHKIFPVTEGWVLNESLEKIVFSLSVDELCPRDKEKRHLKFIDDYVAVYQGPINSNGPLLRVTSIRKETLPEDWKKKIEKGEILFNSEQELLQALDTLDEFH